jgi:hypothetical protein
MSDIPVMTSVSLPIFGKSDRFPARPPDKTIHRRHGRPGTIAVMVTLMIPEFLGSIVPDNGDLWLSLLESVPSWTAIGWGARATKSG